MDEKDADLDRIESVCSEEKNSKVKNFEKEETSSNIFVQILKGTFDFGILRNNLSLTFMCISNFLFFAGYLVVFVFIPIRGKEVIGNKYSLIISIIGNFFLI